MKKHNRFLGFVVAIAMIIGGISLNAMTFAEELGDELINNSDQVEILVDKLGNPNQYSIKTTDSSGNNVNDNFYDTKQDVWVRIDGNPFEYWVFVISPQGTPLGSGGPFAPGVLFNLYAATGFDDTDNNGGSYNVWVGTVPEFNKSDMKNDHFKVRGAEPDDPLGEIDVTKIVKDEDDKVVSNDNTRFHFELYMWVDDGWDEVDEESPFYIDGNGTKTIEGLTLGKYKVVEVDIPDGYDLDAEVDFIEVTLTKMDLEKKAEFTNVKDDDTPPPPGAGSVKIHKRIQRDKGSIDANLGNNTYTITLTGPIGNSSVIRTHTIGVDSSGNFAEFNNLPFGEYIIEETHVNGIPISSSAYHIQVSGNQNAEIVGSSVHIESTGQVERWLVNHETPPPPPWDGTIRVRKLIRENPNASVEGFEFELWMNNEKVAGPLETDIYGEVDFPGLAAGTYEIREVNTDYLAEYLDDNPVTIGPEMGNENDDVWVIRVNNYTIDLDDIVVKKIVSNADEGDSLSGFVFRLYRIVEEGPDEFVGERTTGPSGIVVFEDQPDGDYVLYEVPRAGYFMGIGAPDSDDGYEFSHSIYMEYPIEVTNRKLPPPPDRGFITVEKIVQTRFGNVIQGNNTPFYFELHKRVEGIWVFEDEGSILGNGTLVFGPLDDGEYRVREVDIDDDFDLFTSNNLIVEIENGSDEDLEFINRRVPPPPDDDDDDPPPPDDDDDDPPPPPPTPTPTPTPEPEVVVIEPVPEAPPAVLEEVEVVEEPVPEAAPVAVLPKTGAADPFAISGLGGLLLGLGLFLKKKKEE